MSNIAKIYHAIATSNGRGRCEINGVDFPVSVGDVDIRGIGPSTEVKFKCEVLHEDPRVTKAREFQKYIDTDIASACTIKGDLRHGYTYTKKNYADLNIRKVIFNDPATIVIWGDGTKTVVKACNEPFDPEKGLAMAIVKKAFGNQGNYFNVFKKWIPEKEIVDHVDDYGKFIARGLRAGIVEPNAEIADKVRKFFETEYWYIWMKYYDLAGTEIGEGVHPTPYKYKGSATRRAKQLWGDNPQVKWIVSQTNPWVNEDA